MDNVFHKDISCIEPTELKILTTKQLNTISIDWIKEWLKFFNGDNVNDIINFLIEQIDANDSCATITISKIQRWLNCGYNKAHKIISKLENSGIVKKCDNVWLVNPDVKKIKEIVVKENLYEI